LASYAVNGRPGVLVKLRHAAGCGLSATGFPAGNQEFSVGRSEIGRGRRAKGFHRRQGYGGQGRLNAEREFRVSYFQCSVKWIFCGLPSFVPLRDYGGHFRWSLPISVHQRL